MPAKSKAQQRFFGVVKGIQKGTGKGRGKAKTAARDMSPDDVDDFASTKHTGLPNRVKQETRVVGLIRKMVREIMAEMKEGGPGSGPHPDDEDNPFDREPTDDELGDIEKQFEGDVLDKEREKQRADKEKFRDRQFSDMEKARDREKRLKKKTEGKLKESLRHWKSQVKQLTDWGFGNLQVTFKGKSFGKVKDFVKHSQGASLSTKTFNTLLKKNAIDYNHRKGIHSVGKNAKKYQRGALKLEGFAGGLKKEDQKDFEANRKKQAEVLGYTLTGKTDLKTEIGQLEEEIESVTKYYGILKEGGAQIAKTILQQLGGNKFIAMTGAKNLGHTNKGLQMKIGRNAKGVTHVIIDLDKGKDLYDIEFVKLRGTSRKTVKKLKGIYADQLGDIFKRYTGMNVRL